MNPATFINDIPTETARAAYSGISFTPEKRAEQVRDGYAAELAGDYAELEKLTVGKPGMAEVLIAEFARYREGYRTRYLKKLHSDVWQAYRHQHTIALAKEIAGVSAQAA